MRVLRHLAFAAWTLALLTQSATLAPDWPYPIYDRAFTHLLMNNFEAALADYEQTLKLAARGFFTAYVAADTLIRAKRGQFPRGLYLAYAMLEGQQDPERRANRPSRPRHWRMRRSPRSS